MKIELRVTNRACSRHGSYVLPGMRGQGAGIANANGTATFKNSLIADSVLGKNCSGAVVDGGGNLFSPKTDMTRVSTYHAQAGSFARQL